MTDTVSVIRNTEKDCRERIERENLSAAETLRRVRADCEVREAREREKCREEFDRGCENARIAATQFCAEGEENAFAEAEEFVRATVARVPEAVKYIVREVVG